MKKPDFIPTKISAHDKLTYIKETKSFSAFDSDLPSPSAIWNDSVDYGYTVINDKTGNEVIFSNPYYILNTDNEIEAWVYTSIWPKEHAGYILKIWND